MLWLYEYTKSGNMSMYRMVFFAVKYRHILVFSVRIKRSTTEALVSLYVLYNSMSSSFSNALKCLLKNSVPWSVMIFSGLRPLAKMILKGNPSAKDPFYFSTERLMRIWKTHRCTPASNGNYR